MHATLINHARVTQEIREDETLKKAESFIIKMAALRADKCRCGKLACPVCGFTAFHQRVRSIENNKVIKIGYLTGGKL
jgi:hypothetical protein